MAVAVAEQNVLIGGGVGRRQVRQGGRTDQPLYGGDRRPRRRGGHGRRRRRGQAAQGLRGLGLGGPGGPTGGPHRGRRSARGAGRADLGDRHRRDGGTFGWGCSTSSSRPGCSAPPGSWPLRRPPVIPSDIPGAGASRAGCRPASGRHRALERAGDPRDARHCEGAGLGNTVVLKGSELSPRTHARSCGCSPTPAPRRASSTSSPTMPATRPRWSGPWSSTRGPGHHFTGATRVGRIIAASGGT